MLFRDLSISGIRDAAGLFPTDAGSRFQNGTAAGLVRVCGDWEQFRATPLAFSLNDRTR